MTTTQKIFEKKFSQLSPQFDFVLASQTYFKIGGPAEVFLQPKTKQDFVEVINVCRGNDIPYTILGGASNVVVSDKGIPGVVIQAQHNSFTVLKSNSDTTVVEAESGLKTALFVKQTVDAGLCGVEFFLGVPGTLGGAIYNNAHYLDQLIDTHITQVEILDKAGQSRWLNHKQCHFGYDRSRFQSTKETILAARFSLKKGDRKQSQQIIAQATQYRAKTQPLGIPSSGCIFQNVPNNSQLREMFPQFSQKDFIPAGFLIDQANLKGTAIGQLEVSQKHAAFFVNHGSATANDVKSLIQLVKSRVKQTFGVELKEEVFFLGDI